MPKVKWKPLTIEQENKIKQEYLEKPVKRLAKEIGISGGRVNRFLEKNGLVIPRELIEKRKKDSQRKPGAVPFNKGMKQSEFMTPEQIEKTKATRFKPGNTPHNTNYDGHERVKNGYVEIRVSSGNYRLKHLVEWEKQNGKLPEGHCLICQDGNKTNTDPSNWKLISRAENMLRNSIHNYPEEIIPTMALVCEINKSIKKHENVNREKK